MGYGYGATNGEKLEKKNGAQSTYFLWGLVILILLIQFAWK